MPFVPDSAPAAGRFVPDDDVLKEVKAADKPPPPLSDRIADRVRGMPGQAVQQNLGLGEAALNMGTGMVAKPVSDVAGLAAMLKDVLTGNKGGNPQGFQRDVQERMTYQPRTPTGETMAQHNPIALIAKLFGAAGDKGERFVAPPETSGPARSALGSGVGEFIKQLPSFLGAKTGPVADAAGAGLKSSARNWMQSALKPDAAAQRTGKADKAIDTMLDEGVNVSKGGAEKLQGRIDVLNDKISNLIQGSPEFIDKKATAAYLTDTIKQFEEQVTPLSDIKQIQHAWDEFLAVHPDKIPVVKAQKIKQGTYRSIGDKGFGELKGAEKEAQKTLARGLKEEIAKAVPEVRALNAEESGLLNALSLVEKRAIMEANKNPAGLGWLTTSPEKFAAYMADRSGLFKSLVARMLNTGSKALPPLGAGAPAIGAAASQDRQQLPPPPP